MPTDVKTAKQVLESELARLKKLPEKAASTEVDQCIFATMEHSEVQDLLVDILADNAMLTGVSAAETGNSVKLIEVTVETSWEPGVSYLLGPACVGALVDVASFSVLKVWTLSNRWLIQRSGPLSQP